MGKPAKKTREKGFRFEREFQRKAIDAGIECRAQPGSGAVGTRANESRITGDRMLDPKGWALKVECKSYEKPPNFDRLERARDGKDVLYVDAPNGSFVWASVDFFLEQMARAYTTPGIAPHSFSTLKAGSRFTTFDNWMKGEDLLAVKKDHAGACVWLPYSLWLDVLANAAQGSFIPTDDEPERETLFDALVKISRLGNGGQLSLEEYVRRADEIAVEAIVQAEAA